jgi:hypothetical protein
VRQQRAFAVSLIDRRFLALVALSGVVAVGVARGALSPPGRAASSGACSLSWTGVPSPEMRDAELFSVAADTPEDAWAVGASSRVLAKPPQGLIEHWDGSRWNLIASPAVPAGDFLLGVSVTAADDAWAVGESARYYLAGEAAYAFAVAEHWDGHRWSRVPTPGLRSLRAVAESSATDVWAVGADASGAAVVLHWDGSHWQVRLRLPDDELLSVAALSPNDVWVGGSEPAKKIPRYLELHWNGRRWSSYSQPSSPDDQGAPEVVAIGASSGRDVWAAGDVEGPDGDSLGYAATVLLHWNETGWRNVATRQNRFVSSAPSERHTTSRSRVTWAAEIHPAPRSSNDESEASGRTPSLGQARGLPGWPRIGSKGCGGSGTPGAASIPTSAIRLARSP